MTEVTIDEGAPIVVEFSQQPGVEQVSLLHVSPEELKAKSEQALDAAMDTIRHMAKRVSGLRESIPVEFSKVEIEFGIKLDWEAGVLLAKAGTEGSINVTLTWERKDRDDD